MQEFRAKPSGGNPKFWKNLISDARREAKEFALLNLEEAAACNPENVTHACRYASHLAERGKLMTAKDTLDRTYLRLKKANARERLMLGENYLKLCPELLEDREAEAVLDCGNKAIKLYPQIAYRAHLEMALAHRQRNEPTAAIAGYKKYLEVIPDDAFALCELGESIWNLDESKASLLKAKDCFLKALDQEDCDEGRAHFNLGYICEKMKDHGAAKMHCRLSLKYCKNEYVYNLLGNIYYYEGDYEHAEEYYDEALKLNPLFDDAIANLAEVYRITGREKLANDFLERKKKERYGIELRNTVSRHENYSYF